MSRRFEARLKYQLPLTLSSAQGDSPVEGSVYDISATHFRAQFPSELSTHKRYRFKIVLPDQREIRGRAKVERVPSQNGHGTYTYIFLMESFPMEEELMLVSCIERESHSLMTDRRQATDGPEYRKNRRLSDRKRSSTDRQRVVLTGIGVVCANAIGRAAFWKAIQEQQSGIREITAFDTAAFPVKIAGEVNTEALLSRIPHHRATHMSRATQLGWLAAKLALEDAEFDPEQVNRDRVGVAMGTTLGTLDWAFDQYASLHAKGYQAEHPYAIAAGSSNAISGEISVEYGFRGPSFTFSQGCSSASVAIACGLDLIQLGKADVMVVGGTDAPLNPTVFGGFVRSGMLSKSCPGWKGGVITRDDCLGSTLGEGGCVLVLESYERALQRGAPMYAELLSSGSTSDGYHMLFPHPAGRGVARAIRGAMEGAQIEKEHVDLVIGHLAGIKEAHDIELRVLRRELGHRFPMVPITNVKPLIGYTQGACGAFEVAAACLAFQQPTKWITYNFPHEPTKAHTALINCIGFGGKNVSLILKRTHDQ